MLLAIDTATASASVALSRDGRLVAEFTWDVGRRHSQELMDRVAAVLKSALATPQDLTGITVASGPGSFNGVRVGVTAAKALAFALGIPLVAFSTLDVLADGVEVPCGTICAVLEAGRGEVYCATYQRGTAPPAPAPGAPQRVVEGLWRSGPPAVATPDALATALSHAAEPIIVCGEWRAETRAALLEALGTRVWFASPVALRRAAWLLGLALAAAPSDWTHEPATIEALYLRRPAITISHKQSGFA